MPSNLERALAEVSTLEEAVATPAVEPVDEETPTQNCEQCGNELDESVDCIATVDGMAYCEDCVAQCDCCHCDTPTENCYEVYSDCGTDTYCERCYYNEAWHCEGCCRQFAQNVDAYFVNDERLCDECAESARREREDRGAILSYHSSKRLDALKLIESDWTKERKRWLGVELEVEVRSGWEPEGVAEDLLTAVNADQRLLWAEHDSSLNDGFELITQPMGLDKQRALWANVLQQYEVRALRSHNTSTCGLHVHVSKRGLRSLQIAKAQVWLNELATEPFLKLIARRYATAYSQRKYKKFTEYRSENRYELLNTTPRHTVEFRLFRGTLRADSLLACVEFSNAVLDWCADASMAQLNVAEFLRWLWKPENARDTGILRTYILDRASNVERAGAPQTRAALEAATGKGFNELYNATKAKRPPMPVELTNSLVLEE